MKKRPNSPHCIITLPPPDSPAPSPNFGKFARSIKELRDNQESDDESNEKKGKSLDDDFEDDKAKMNVKEEDVEENSKNFNKIRKIKYFQGYLLKRIRRLKIWKLRYFIIDLRGSSKKITYYKTEEHYLKKMKPKGVIEITENRLEKENKVILIDKAYFEQNTNSIQPPISLVPPKQDQQEINSIKLNQQDLNFTLIIFDKILSLKANNEREKLEILNYISKKLFKNTENQILLDDEFILQKIFNCSYSQTGNSYPLFNTQVNKNKIKKNSIQSGKINLSFGIKKTADEIDGKNALKNNSPPNLQENGQQSSNPEKKQEFQFIQRIKKIKSTNQIKEETNIDKTKLKTNIQFEYTNINNLQAKLPKHVNLWITNYRIIILSNQTDYNADDHELHQQRENVKRKKNKNKILTSIPMDSIRQISLQNHKESLSDNFSNIIHQSLSISSNPIHQFITVFGKDIRKLQFGFDYSFDSEFIFSVKYFMELITNKLHFTYHYSSFIIPPPSSLPLFEQQIKYLTNKYLIPIYKYLYKLENEWNRWNPSFAIHAWKFLNLEIYHNHYHSNAPSSSSSSFSFSSSNSTSTSNSNFPFPSPFNAPSSVPASSSHYSTHKIEYNKLFIVPFDIDDFLYLNSYKLRLGLFHFLFIVFYFSQVIFFYNIIIILVLHPILFPFPFYFLFIHLFSSPLPVFCLLPLFHLFLFLLSSPFPSPLLTFSPLPSLYPSPLYTYYPFSLSLFPLLSSSSQI